MFFIEESMCTGCGLCATICPGKAIELFPNKYGFLMPQLNEEKCIHCNLCEINCPQIHPHFTKKSGISHYAAWIDPRKIPSKSSSGGIADALAKIAFERNYSVYGASFDDEWNLQHIKVKNNADFVRIQGSKYTQSNAQKCYCELLGDLKAGREVLFIGCPCQIAAVRNLVPDEFENKVLLIDFICHGVPSSTLFKNYVSFLEQKFHDKVIDYNFRSKKGRWKKLYVSVTYSHSKKSYKADYCPYHTWFGNHLSLRESCFTCKYRMPERFSDITIADFWKVEQFYPNFPTDQGVSAVQINTKKGDQLFNEFIQKRDSIFHPVSSESIWSVRNTGNKKMDIPFERELFWKTYEKEGIKGVVKKYPASNILKLVVDKMSYVLKLNR